ncbi:anthranilate phosphoribosyltransferase [Pontibacillus chungwhensis BH030062]|uniref:Anthranilate phosphoribosyltransferase n=1 Tax=Pontibacillus chungwhensis BH030062 TaxID=1385513 RepID=A0A0A2UST3_9BACI|nr:anthranilate phosphoribosyltransferase [Pontibacillus chungwhensis]KGP90984.1 anthranilate phosphoribosyltransferase [Pontibacillus chungwhensis BH030062]
MLKATLNRLLNEETLTEQEAFQIMDLIMQGEIGTEQLASFLSILRFRGETVEELLGFTKGMRKHMRTIQHSEEVVVDTCGTGGDGLSTFNISTAVAIVLASMDVKVAKHGNRKVSSASGSADVLEYLGVPVDTTAEQAAEMLETTGMTFLFAPNYHQAMKHAVTARRELGFRTAFNVLGPLSNPANARHQVIGIYDTSLGEKLAHTLHELGSEHVLLVTGKDGLDEFSIAEQTNVVELKEGVVTRTTVEPEQFGLKRGRLEDVQVKNSLESANLIQAIFEGTANESARDIVILNAGAGLYVGGRVSSIEEGVQEVQKALMNKTVHHYYQSLRHTLEGARYA